MRLFEILNSSFYLWTKERQRIGSEAGRPTDVYPLGSALEGRLEQRRPDDAIPREKSLYLHEQPSEAAAYVYAIEPIGQIDRHHTAWLRLLKGADLTQRGVIDQYVTGYWSGKELPEGRDEPWEYRARNVRIIKRVGGCARD